MTTTTTNTTMTTNATIITMTLTIRGQMTKTKNAFETRAVISVREDDRSTSCTLHTHHGGDVHGRRCLHIGRCLTPLVHEVVEDLVDVEVFLDADAVKLESQLLRERLRLARLHHRLIYQVHFVLAYAHGDGAALVLHLALPAPDGVERIAVGGGERQHRRPGPGPRETERH